MYYVYCLKWRNGKKLYYGFTSNLKRRCKEHGAKWMLLYYEAYAVECDARRRERKLKDYGQARSRLKSRLKESIISAG